jgi:hypothetical protein
MADPSAALQSELRDRYVLGGQNPFSTLDATATEVLWALLRGRVGERLGEGERAIRSYTCTWVAGMWWNADAELQPYVQEARDGVTRLTGEGHDRRN